ncbi:MAG: excinuclease ABC subunit UvrC [Elusimicrobiota bacterium]
MPEPAPERQHLPHACGVYIMRDAAMGVLYVGKAKDLAKRVAQYFNPNKPELKNQLLAPLVRAIDYIYCASEREALIWENRLIKRHQPFFNAMLKDDKSYPYIRLSMNEDFPRLRIARRKQRDGALYFGPYPRVGPIRSLLRRLWKRRIFPLRPCDWSFSARRPLEREKIQSCLYYHTGECPAPCAGRITPAAYRRIADGAALFFCGQYRKLRRSLERKMRTASKALEYEKAAALRDTLEGIAHMGERVRYQEVRPNKVTARLDASRAVTDLQQALRLPRPPHAVECFDISHLHGRGTVASMVRFSGGAPEKSRYRRYRIRTVSGIDDCASIAEAVHRRYRALRTEKKALPDLILIDGGKGQLAAAAKSLAELKLNIPLAALAKRDEEIFLPGRGRAVRLERNRPALRLLQRLRDEAHRFAVSYNRLLRKKELLG